ncbi:hypothetical protein QTG54_001573 [Skeletonema marinoi]|uniref:FZ domain-containing protein n=1 Tax=Skeletonema marinoi TaxID=267567 RepID=A0AAD8YLM5_9STRA|nr:hypothetical protein QTG54_001573 [Skeletonema marinoi]
MSVCDDGCFDFVDEEATLEEIEAAKGRWDSDIPFCGKYINSFPACVPSSSTLRIVPEWMSSDANEDLNAIREKDRRLQQETDAKIAERISLGRNTTDTFETRIAKMPTQRTHFQETLPLCQSACENMFRVCGFEQDVWICGKTSLMEMTNGPRGPFFLVSHFVFDCGGEPKAVCTPSIRGPASTFGVSLVINAGVASLVLLFLVH